MIKARSASTSPASRSTTADFKYTRSPAPFVEVVDSAAFSRAFARRALARSICLLSNSSLNAASHMSSESGFAANDSSSTARAPETSPRRHSAFAAISHNTTALGHRFTARFKTTSIFASFPESPSSRAYSTQRDFFPGNASTATSYMLRAVSTEPRANASAASAFQVRLRSASSTPAPAVARTMARHVSGLPAFSAVSASLSQYSRSTETPLFRKLLIARSMILCTMVSRTGAEEASAADASVPSVANDASSGSKCASSSSAAAIQICGSAGNVSRALFSTTRAFSLVSNRASASHRSTCCGQHSTARASKIFASSSWDRSTTAFHSRTDVGTRSSALRNTRRLRTSSSSNCAARIHSSTLFGNATTALARTARATSGGFRRAFSSHASADVGHASHPLCAKLRAAAIFPASSSRRAAAIQPGACFGLVLMTDLSRRRAFFTSEISDVEDTFTLESEVRYPLGSTTV